MVPLFYCLKLILSREYVNHFINLFFRKLTKFIIGIKFLPFSNNLNMCMEENCNDKGSKFLCLSSTPDFVDG